MRRATSLLVLALVAAACAGSTPDTAPMTVTTATNAPATTAATTATTTAPGPLVEFIAGEDELVLRRGAQGAWDSEVMRFPNVVFHDGLFHLFYEGRAERGESFEGIGYAISDDGLEWTKHEANPIVLPDGSGFDALAVSRPVVTVSEDAGWVMYYAGLDEEGRGGVGVATAETPAGPWQRPEEPLITAGPEGAWDHGMILPDQVIDAGTELRLYYSGRDRDGGVARIGLATSADGASWEKHNDPATDQEFAESDPVLFNDQPWDRRATWTPNIFPNGEGWAMIYNGFGHLGIATSDDGVAWEKFEGNPVHRSQSLFHPFVLPMGDDTYWVFYRQLSAETLRRLEGTFTFP